MGRDCQLMGLTWLLARNKTAYIPTVSAVLRALLYTNSVAHMQSTCSPDRENMPLAVDSLQFQRLTADSSVAPFPSLHFIGCLRQLVVGMLCLLFWHGQLMDWDVWKMWLGRGLALVCPFLFVLFWPCKFFLYQPPFFLEILICLSV